MTGLFVMYFALEAYLRVDKVYSKFWYQGDTFAIITVLEFPPSES